MNIDISDAFEKDRHKRKKKLIEYLNSKGFEVKKNIVTKIKS